MKTDVKIYPLVSDIMFKHIFGYQKNARFTSDLLESFYNLKPGALKDIVITNSVKLDSDTIKNKRFETDIEVRLSNGEYINIEVYQLFDKNASIKSIMYIASSFAGQLKAGEKYSNTKKYTQLNFVKNNTSNDRSNIINKYLLINQNNSADEMIPELLQIYVINLDCREDISYNCGKETRFKRWVKLMDANNIEELERIAKGDKLMSEVVKEIKLFSGDRSVQNYYAQQALIDSQHESQLEEENLKGQEEAMLDVAKSMLRDNIDLNIIKKHTNLSITKLEELKKELKEDDYF